MNHVWNWCKILKKGIILSTKEPIKRNTIDMKIGLKLLSFYVFSNGLCMCVDGMASSMDRLAHLGLWNYGDASSDMK